MSLESTSDSAEGTAPEQAQAPSAPPRVTLGQACATGAGAGVLGGVVSHSFTGGRLGLPAFVIAVLLLGGLRGAAAWVALLIYGIVAGTVVAILGLE